MSDSPLIRCTCGALLSPGDTSAPSVRCPVCAAVIPLRGGPPRAPATRARIRPKAHRDEEQAPPPAESQPAVDDAEEDLEIAEPVLDDDLSFEPAAASDPEPPAAGPVPKGVPAQLLQAMPKRRPDPIFLWGTAAAIGLVMGVLGYVVGHAHGMSDVQGDPARAVVVAKPDEEEDEENVHWTNETERELFRLCRLLEETRPTFDDPLEETTASGKARLARWAKRWRAGWSGPLGDAIRDLDLSLDWTCHVAGFEIGEGFACRARAGGEVAFRLNPLGLGAKFYKGQEAIREGDRLKLEGVREAIKEGTDTYLQVGTECVVALVTDQVELVEIER